MKAIASSASNTWGLFLLVLLLGYALVEVPRRLWNKSNHSYTLTQSYFKVAKLSSDKCEAEEIVDDVLEVRNKNQCISRILKRNFQSLQAVSLAIRPGNILHHHMDTILLKIPAELKDRMNRRQLPDDTPTDMPSEKTLIRLHKQVTNNKYILYLIKHFPFFFHIKFFIM